MTKESSIKAMVIDGIAASAAIDSSGEILDIEGCDISDLESGVGVLNFEHKDDGPSDTIGKIIYALKIFKKDDCEDPRQEFYWNKVKLPFIYIKARLYDGAGHPGAIAAAAMIRDHHANNEPLLARYSIEGSTLKKEGNRLVRSMARKVALTLRPCNKSAISGLLSDPNGPAPVTEKQATKSLLQELADTVKSEFASYEMEVDPLVKDEPIYKADAVGNADVAPSQLTGIAATMREDLGPTESLEAHRERVRNQIKAALRDYDEIDHKDTKKFLKMYLPEADDSFCEHFENLIDDVKSNSFKDVLQRNTRKMEYWQLELKRLLKAGTEPEKPAEEPAGVAKEVEPAPEEDTDIVDYSRHAHPKYTFMDEQRQLMHGIDMEDLNYDDQQIPSIEGGFRAGIAEGRWRKVLGGTEVGYVKHHSGGPSAMPTNAEAEGLYHNLSHKFFGTGKYVPTVAVFQNPAKKGEIVHVIRKVPSPSHYQNDNVQNKTIGDLHESGELDKLLLQNAIMSNSDRHGNNYLFGNNNTTLHLIDHGYTFWDSDYGLRRTPDYYEEAAEQLEGKAGVYGIRLHPAAREWLLGLDKEKLRSLMKEHDAPKSVIDHTVERLDKMQAHVAATPDVGAIEAFGSVEPQSHTFTAAKKYREQNDPEALRIAAEKRRNAAEEEQKEVDRQERKGAMIDKLAALKEEHPDLAIHDLAMKAGFNPDVRHQLFAHKNDLPHLGVVPPNFKEGLDRQLDDAITRRLAQVQRDRQRNTEIFIRDAANKIRANPQANLPIFNSVRGGEELDRGGLLLGIKRKEGEDDDGYRNRLEEELRPRVDDAVHRMDLEEAHGINNNKDKLEAKAVHTAHMDKMAASMARGADSEGFATMLPNGRDLDLFAKREAEYYPRMPLRNGMGDEEYKAAVANELKGGRLAGWAGPFVDRLENKARHIRRSVEGLADSILNYKDGGYDADKVIERLNLGLHFDEENTKDVLSYLGIDAAGINQGVGVERRQAIVKDIYQKIVNDPLFEKKAKERAKKKAFAAYQERQAALKERQNRILGQGKRRRKKVEEKVKEQKPAVQEIMDANRGGTHGTLPTKETTASEQTRLFPKE